MPGRGRGLTPDGPRQQGNRWVAHLVGRVCAPWTDPSTPVQVSLRAPGTARPNGTQSSESGADKGLLLHDARRRVAPTLKTPNFPKVSAKPFPGKSERRRGKSLQTSWCQILCS